MAVRCEECFDRAVSGVFDLPVVGAIDVSAEEFGRVGEPFVVVGVAVAEIGACGERSAFVNAERLGATNASTANDGRLRSRAIRDVECEGAVFGGKVEPPQDRVA